MDDRKIGFGFVAIAIMILAVFLYWIATEHRSTNEAAVTNTTNSVSVYEREFIAGCVSGGGSVAFCQCGYQHMRQNHSNQEIIEMSEHLDAGAMPEPIMEAAAACIDNL